MRKNIEFFRVQRAVVLRDLMLQRIETERMEEEIQKEVGKLKDLHEQAERYRKEKESTLAEEEEQRKEYARLMERHNELDEEENK